MKRLLYFILGAILFTGVAAAQSLPSQSPLWVSGSYITTTPLNTSLGFQIPSLANNNCLGTDGSGHFQAGTCSGGGGSGVATTSLTATYPIKVTSNSATINFSLLDMATTTATCSGTVSCSQFVVIGSSPITITGSGGTNYFTNSGANTYLNTGTNLEAPTFAATSTSGSSIFSGNLLIGTTTALKTFTVESSQGGGIARFLRDVTSPITGAFYGTQDISLNELGSSLANFTGPTQTFGAFLNGSPTQDLFGEIGAYRDGADTSGGFEINPNDAGTLVNGILIDHLGETAIATSSTNSNQFSVQNQNSGDNILGLYSLAGVLKASVSNSGNLVLNGNATTTGNFVLNSTGYVQGFFGPYDSSPASNVEVNCQSEGAYCGFGIKDNNGGGTFDGALFLDLTDEPSGIAQPLIVKNNTGYATCLAIEGGGYGCLNDYNTLASLWTVISPAYSSSGTEAGLTATMLGASGNDNTDYGIQQYPADGSPATGIDAYQNYYSTSYAQPLPEPDFSFYEQTNNNESGTAWHWLVATTTPTGAEGTTTSLCFGDVGSTTPSAFANCGVLASSPTVSVMSSSSRTTAFDVSTITNNVFTHNFDVLNNGNVGIGTQSPTALLDILGDYPLFKVRNTDTAQYSGAGFDLINSNVSGGQAGYTFYAGINDVADTQGFLSLDETNASGAGTGHVMVVTGTSTIDFYPFVGISTTTPGSLFSVGGVANLTAATSTFYSTGGINLSGGCYAINGTCLPTTNASSTLLSDNNTFSGNDIFSKATGTPSLTVGYLISTSTEGTATSTFQGSILANQGGDTDSLPGLSCGTGTGNNYCVSMSGGRGMLEYDGQATLQGGASHGIELWVNDVNNAPGGGTKGLVIIGTNGATNFADVGLGTTTPTARLVTVAASSTLATSAYNGLVNIVAGFENTTLKLFQEIDQWGHLITSGDTPTITSCGSTPSGTVSGNDRNGTITVGGTATGCVLTFAHAYATAPDCVISNQGMSVVNALTYTVSASAITISQTGLSSDLVNYICQAHQ